MSNIPTKTDTRAVKYTFWLIIFACFCGLAFAAKEAIAEDIDGTTVAAWYYQWDQFDPEEKLVKVGQIQGLAVATYETTTTLFGAVDDPEAYQCVYKWLPKSEGEVKHVIATTMKYTQFMGLDPSEFRFADVFTSFLLHECFPDKMDETESDSNDEWRST